MPRGDGTGPLGQGPGMGRGMGRGGGNRQGAYEPFKFSAPSVRTFNY